MLMRGSLVVIAAVVVAGLAAACGSSSNANSNSSPSSSNQAAVTSSAPTSGPGLTAPTVPAGSKTSGGTVYYTEGPSAPPNYIFPMTSAQVCGTNNIAQLNAMLYRPLYWCGTTTGRPPTTAIRSTSDMLDPARVDGMEWSLRSRSARRSLGGVGIPIPWPRDRRV